jgi:predicted RNase H-like HicB family nuclease
MPVDVASFGDTPQAARSAVEEAVRLFVQTAEDHGTLEQVLEESRKSHAATE